MRRAAPILALILTGCIFEPCVPTEHWQVLDTNGAVLLQSKAFSEVPAGACVLAGTRPYDELVGWGVPALLYEWECGCV